MQAKAQGWRVWLAIAALGWLAGGCGDGDGPGTTIPTRTPTNLPAPTPTVTPRQEGLVSGVLVARGDIGARARDGDALGMLTPEVIDVVGDGSSRALAFADWTIDGKALRGVTAEDGRFEVGGLPPGRHLMRVTKTIDGNLMELVVPITVGDDGAAQILAEVAWGLVRSTSVFTGDGAEMRETVAPNGSRLLMSDGQLTEFSDGSRTFVDPDGDGRFDIVGCEEAPALWRCPADRNCGPDRTCACTSSCPFCEDCGPLACLPADPLLPPICGPDDIPCVSPRFPPAICRPDGTCGLLPYACKENGSCDLPGDRCVCVASCPECDDCAFSVCVAGCEPVEITGLRISAPTELVVGQTGQASAIASLSDGSHIDVTWLAEWGSSDDDVASIDSWGTVYGLATGTAALSATFADAQADPWPLAVVERPTLRHIYVQNTQCYYRLGAPKPGEVVGPIPPTDDFLPSPICGDVVRIGATIQFTALGEFENGYYQDITGEVDWRVEPAAVADIADGLFTARAEGTAHVTAFLEGVTSDDRTIRVVAQSSLVALSIYPANWGYPALLDGPVRPGADAPCFDCGYGLTVLKGEQIQFQATAHYDTGEWEDVTARVAWHTSDASVATIDAAGLMTAAAAGEVAIAASLDGVDSSPVTLRVVNEAALLSLSIYLEGTSTKIGKGEQAFFHAVGYYDIGFSHDVTDRVTWKSSNETAGHFGEPGVFTGDAAGSTQISAELAGVQSNELEVEVYETSALEYCNPSNVNRGTWSDDFNRVVLESDCAEYTRPGVVTLRYTVTETQPHGGIFDPCLDLYVYQGATRIRTIREEGCGEPFVAMGAPDRAQEVLKYQWLAFWDLKTERGETVEPGTYTIIGRFYLYYDPVVSIDVTVH